MSDYLQEDDLGDEAETTTYYSSNNNNSIFYNVSTSTIAMTILFGSIIFTTSSVAARLWLTGLWRWRNCNSSSTDIDINNYSKQQEPLDTKSLSSIYNLLYQSTIFALILFYSYICEHHPLYFHEEKTYDRDEFFFWTILIVVFAGGHSVKANSVIKNRRNRKNIVNKSTDNKQLDRIQEDQKSTISSIQQKRNHNQHSISGVAPENEVLNRYQTEEWKGWMQFTFLLYHYMHAMEIYNGIRVMITCYVWLTGYGNFTYYYNTNDYSLVRTFQMLWRLNFLVFFLCLVHGNTYILYYICPLHTYFFGMVYIIMYIGKEKNYTKWWIRIKLGIASIVIYLLWDVDMGIFDKLVGIFLSNEPVIGATMGERWEWYFRSYLDHWSTLLGMIFAYNYPVMLLFFRKLEAKRKNVQYMSKLAIALAMLTVFYLWMKGPLMYEKISYNGTNPYFGIIPLLTYIYLRNITPKMRSYTMELIHEIGKTTLETYLMQHHIWLTSNSKTILVLIPGWPRVNLALVTYLYVIISRKLHKLTLLLRGMLLPNDRQACINSLISMGVTIAGFYCTAYLLESLDMCTGFVIGVVSMLCGTLLYQTVIDSSWSRYRQTVKKMKHSTDEDDYSATSQSEMSDFSTEDDSKDESIYSKLCPPLIGAMVVILLGLTWNEFAAAGASAIGRLPSGCDAFVNDGIWVPIDGCNESSRGMAYRNYGAASYGTCQPHGNSYVWAWKDQPSRTHCRFGHRNEARLKKALSRRQVVFVGDSMTRYIYHASMRAMGITNSGEYDATGPKHADISNTLWGTTPIDFKWAPLATDQLISLKEINRQATGSAGNKHPDLIVLGGGAWDRLHVYASDEDRQSHAATLKELAKEMQKAQDSYGSAVVWFIPTTINSQALNTEEKRDHMREEDMEAMRAVYARNGILSSSSFVIDGPAFTSSRASEIYDGVHYPIDVYSAGAQILFNSLDWLLPPDFEEPVIPPRIGKMANPLLGLMMLILVVIGLVSFDGFLGFSYLASLFASGVMPHLLQEEAFATLHHQIGVSGNRPPPESLSVTSSLMQRC